jgi:hypothetical protein
MMIVKGANQPLSKVAGRVIINIDHRGNAVAHGHSVLRGLQDTGSRQVSDGFRSVLIAARRNDSVEIIHEIVVDRNSDALHGGLPFCCGPRYRGRFVPGPAGRVWLHLRQSRVSSVPLGRACGACRTSCTSLMMRQAVPTMITTRMTINDPSSLNLFLNTRERAAPHLRPSGFFAASHAPRPARSQSATVLETLLFNGVVGMLPSTSRGAWGRVCSRPAFSVRPNDRPVACRWVLLAKTRAASAEELLT